MLTKSVDGVDVVMSDKEETEIRAEWAKNESAVKPSAKKPVDSIIDDPAQLAALKAALAK